MTKPNSTEITLMRHWDIDAPGLCVGQLDLPLSKSGTISAEQFADLMRLEPNRPDRIICSDLRRSVESALPIADALGIAFEQDARWRELDMGQFTGKSWDAIYTEQASSLAHWGTAWLTEGPPGGESFQALIQRVADALASLASDKRRVWVVTHEGSIRAALAHQGMAPEHAMARRFAYGERVSLDLP